MNYRLLLAALMMCVPPLGLVQPTARAATAAESMRFEWVREGPAEACGRDCREWVAATGPITAQTAKDFERFSETRDLTGATMVLDSGGGSVLASLELGRKLRALGMRTSVGRTVKMGAAIDNQPFRARLSARGECASMCVFVLLAGVERHVPAEARILVHQIWPGSKRHDATAESYTAEEVVRVQRDVGRIARYTVEMGGDIELFELAMRIPPWERLRALTPSEMHRLLRVPMQETATDTPTSGAVEVERPRRSRPSAAVPNLGWNLAEEAAAPMRLVRRHVLTIEGEEIGQFELTLVCGEPGGAFQLAYADTRPVTSAMPAAPRLADVSLWLGGERLSLSVEDSGLAGDGGEMRSRASAPVAPALFENLSRQPNAVLVVGTRTTDDVRTSTRFGGTGLAKIYPRFAARCGRVPAPQAAVARP